jgi:thymidylate synthase
MKLVTAQNVNDAYVSGMTLLNRLGIERASRNGPVLVCPEPVTTHYSHPRERVLFNKQRDANPFFHLFEALWMLTGGRDVKFPAYFVPRMADFSDDGETFNAAYGFRWRRFGLYQSPIDQLEVIIKQLRVNRDDRRVVLQMWDPYLDLATNTKDAACNVTAKFSIFGDALNMIVFNRSNDIIMGCYGANAVHFSILQEYLAQRIGVSVGWYEQVSSDFHAYLGKDWSKMWPLAPSTMDDPNWYDTDNEAHVVVEPLMSHPAKFDVECAGIVGRVRHDRVIPESVTREFYNQFFHVVCQPMSVAYAQYRDGLLLDAIHTMDVALDTTRQIDWLVAGRRWLNRRLKARTTEAG